MRSGHISLPDRDLGREGGWVLVSGERREEREREEVSPSGNIYVMAGSVVHCSHHTGGAGGGTGGAGGAGG